MKKTVLSFLLSGLFAFTTNATVYTVSNNTALPGSPGQYTTVTAAIAAASSGDTIMIQPSATAYAGFTVTKGLVFIGAGYNPQTTSGLKSMINSQIVFGNGSSNSKVIGLRLDGGIGFSNSFAVSDYTIARCETFGHLNFTNGANSPTGTIVIENNRVSGGIVYFSPVTSTTFRNNICDMGGSYIDAFSSSTTDYIRNNTFICSGNNAIHNALNDVIENNIFYSNVPNATTVQSCTFNNNYVFGTTTLPYGSNVGSGNITNTNPVWPVFTCGQAFAYTTDYRPVSGHVCINGGTDGTDIGATGGAAPFYRYAAPYPMTGEPPIPQVREVNILVSSVPSGGTLNINVKARKRD